MVCTVKLYEKPILNNPVLIEGLPGIGFVANIASLHLIRELNAKLFGEIHSSAFQDFAISTEEGKPRLPVNELYYHKRNNGESDLIILYGNTQALTTVGQYELGGKILDLAEQLGCRKIITLGGLRRQGKIDSPKLFCTATDHASLQEAVNLGAQIISGQIFGLAGILIGLGKLRGFKGVCLLAETLGLYPDVLATQKVLEATCKMLNLNVDFARLEQAAQTTRNVLEVFGLLEKPTEEKREDEESEIRWSV